MSRPIPFRPWLLPAGCELVWPDPNQADPDEGLVAVGGDLTAERLLSAYARGIFLGTRATQRFYGGAQSLAPSCDMKICTSHTACDAGCENPISNSAAIRTSRRWSMVAPSARRAPGSRAVCEPHTLDYFRWVGHTASRFGVAENSSEAFTACRSGAICR